MWPCPGAGHGKQPARYSWQRDEQAPYGFLALSSVRRLIRSHPCAGRTGKRAGACREAEKGIGVRQEHRNDDHAALMPEWSTCLLFNPVGGGGRPAGSFPARRPMTLQNAGSGKMLRRGSCEVAGLPLDVSILPRSRDGKSVSSTVLESRAGARTHDRTGYGVGAVAGGSPPAAGADAAGAAGSVPLAGFPPVSGSTPNARIPKNAITIKPRTMKFIRVKSDVDFLDIDTLPIFSISAAAHREVSTSRVAL